LIKLNRLRFIAVPNTAKNGTDNKYLPAKINKIIETIDTRIIPNLNIPEKVFLSILEISQRAPYKIIKITKLKIIRFINELST
tara:strand:- start:630 stop:878 length:249 start_codon:yes stop_codon:yes gene_type:complete